MKKHLMRKTLRHKVPVYVAFMRNSLALIGLTTLLVAVTLMARSPFPVQEESPLSPTLPGNEGGFVTGLIGLDSTSESAVVPREAQAEAVLMDNEGRRESANTSVVLTPAAQAGISRYLARKYHVSADAIALMVQEAYLTGREVGLDPSLLLAVIGVESGFNPFAESGVGAQGLMQVMSKVHSAKFEGFGGTRAALDPVANIRIGAFILKDCIRRGGSVRDGLRLYVGSTTEEDGGYGLRVMQEKDRIQLAAHGGNPAILPVVAPAPGKSLPVAGPPAKNALARNPLPPRAEASSARPGEKLAAL